MYKHGICISFLVVYFISHTFTADVRLTDSKNEDDGAVQVYIGGVWRYLCDYISSVEEDVICQDLGYISSAHLYDKLQMNNTVGYWKTHITCGSNDSELVKCSNTGWTYSNSCPSYKTNAVICHGEVKFDRSFRTSMGAIFVYDQDYGYQTLCGEDLTKATAQVFCRQLRFVSASPYQLGSDYKEMGNAAMKKVSYNCAGTESRLNECATVEASLTCTNSSPAATVICEQDLREVGDVRELNKGYGAVWVYDDQAIEWNLCADGFDDNVAKVVCRELGFGENGRRLPSTAYPYYTHAERNKTFNCSGSEKRLSECSSYTSSVCKTREVAAVACKNSSDSSDEGVTRISASHQVEVFYHGIWGSVCGAHWDDNAAKVVCGNTTFAKAATAFSVLPVWIFEVKCAGDEDSLTSCQITKDDPMFNCDYSQGAVAYCIDDSPGDKYEYTLTDDKYEYSLTGDKYEYSLTGGGSNYGYVQLTKNGEKGYAISLKSESMRNISEAACNSLGFHGGEPYDMPALVAKRWWDVSVNADFKEYPRLQPLNARAYYSGSQQKYISVFCFDKVRLVGGSSRGSGYVLGFKYNTFYAYCTDSFTDRERDAVCREMGFGEYDYTPHQLVFDPTSIGFNNLTCPENAGSTDNCTAVFTGSDAGCLHGKARVSCHFKDDNNGSNQAIQASGIITTVTCFIMVYSTRF